MSAENLVGNLPNKSFGEYQRPLPRDFELASSGDVSWKDETGTYAWDKMPVLPAGIFTSFDSSVTAVDQAIYIGNGDTTSVQAAWGSISQFDWVRYTADTSVWSAITPTEGQLCYDTSGDSWFTYDSTSLGWLQSSQSGVLTETTINIGDWNMNSTAEVPGSNTVTVAHGLSSTEWKTIREIDVIIRNDDDNVYYKLDAYSLIGAEGGIDSFDDTNFYLLSAGVLFDSTAFDSESYNRGWVTFKYTKDAS